MYITLILDYSIERPSGGPNAVAFDTVQGLMNNAGRLEKEDLHIHVLSRSSPRYSSNASSDDATAHISIDHFQSRRPRAFLSDINYIRQLKKIKHQDLIHSHVLSGALAGCHLKFPTILTLHGMIWRERNFSTSRYSRLAMDINNLRFARIAPKLKRLFAISPYVVEEVGNYFTTNKPDMRVIENPVSDIYFETGKKEIPGLLLYPAGIKQLKNQSTLIKALSILKQEKIEFRCLLPGKLTDSMYVEELAHSIHLYGLEKDVVLPGLLPYQQMLDLYSQASIMVSTSFQETAPMIISEAMATGTPVIAPKISGIPYMVSDGNSGFLIDPHSAEDIATRIAILLDDDKVRAEFGRESRRIALTRWKPDVIVNQLIDEYTNLS